MGDVILTATYLINRMPSRVLNFQTPIQTFLKCFPNSHLLHHIPLKVLGCTSFVHIHSHNRNKLEPRVVKCIFLRYSPNQKGYKCYFPTLKKLYPSMDFPFLEMIPSIPILRFRGEVKCRTAKLGSHHTISRASHTPYWTRNNVFPETREPSTYIEQNSIQSLQVYSWRKHNQRSHDPRQTQHVQDSSTTPNSSNLENNTHISENDFDSRPIAIRKGNTLLGTNVFLLNVVHLSQT